MQVWISSIASRLPGGQEEEKEAEAGKRVGDTVREGEGGGRVREQKWS